MKKVELQNMISDLRTENTAILQVVDMLSSQMSAQSVILEARLKQIEADVKAINLCGKANDEEIQFINENIGTVIDTVQHHTTRINALDLSES